MAVAAHAVLGRRTGFLHDLATVAGRALRAVPREPTAVIPAVLVPAFFYTTNLGALEKVARYAVGFSYKAFLVPMAIAFAVTGMSRAPALLTDVQSGYFDRLCMTPVRRLALLLGLMAADMAGILLLFLPVPAVGLAGAVRFVTALPGRFPLIRPVALCG